jgi:hypothetical protein
MCTSARVNNLVSPWKFLIDSSYWFWFLSHIFFTLGFLYICFQCFFVFSTCAWASAFVL